MAKKLTEDQVLKIAQRELANSMGLPGDDISVERARAWDYYQRKLFGNEEEDLSKVVSSDVMEVVDGIMPQLIRMFTTQDNLLTFDAVGMDDEQRAMQETQYVSHLFFKRNPAFEIMFFWFFDALVQKNGYVKCYWDEAERVTTEHYSGLSFDELSELLDDDELTALERVERDETVIQDGLPQLATGG